MLIVDCGALKVGIVWNWLAFDRVNLSKISVHHELDFCRPIYQDMTRCLAPGLSDLFSLVVSIKVGVLKDS